LAGYELPVYGGDITARREFARALASGRAATEFESGRGRFGIYGSGSRGRQNDNEEALPADRANTADCDAWPSRKVWRGNNIRPGASLSGRAPGRSCVRQLACPPALPSGWIAACSLTMTVGRTQTPAPRISPFQVNPLERRDAGVSGDRLPLPACRRIAAPRSGHLRPRIPIPSRRRGHAGRVPTL
jgi:hypothetical protein